MAAQGGGSPGGFDYNQWAAMNLNKGGDSSAPADTLDDITKKGIDKAVSTVFTKFLGIMNPDIEGKGVIPQETNVGQSMSLAQGGFLGIFKDTGGVLAQILKYFTRDLPANLMEMFGLHGDGGGGASGGGSSGSDYSGSSGSADYSAGFVGGGHAGGGDFHGHASLGGGHGADYGESMVNYGGKMIVASASEIDLGQLRPQATPIGDDRLVSRGGGMEV